MQKISYKNDPSIPLVIILITSFKDHTSELSIISELKMKKIIVVSCIFAMLNFQVHAVPISTNKMENISKEANGSENSIQEENESSEENSVSEVTEKLIVKWEKNSNGLVVIPYQFDPESEYRKKENLKMNYDNWPKSLHRLYT